MAAKVLLVDDSRAIRMHVSQALQQAGFEVVEAEDGKAALQRLEQEVGVSLVLCDVTMPRMSGIEFLEALRQDGRLARLPVVMLTTEGQRDLVLRAKELGAKGWIVKPFKPELLVAAAKKLSASA